MVAEVGTVTVKVVLDTTEFDAALERVKAALEELGNAAERCRIVSSYTAEDTTEATKDWDLNTVSVRRESRPGTGLIREQPGLSGRS